MSEATLVEEQFHKLLAKDFQLTSVKKNKVKNEILEDAIDEPSCSKWQDETLLPVEGRSNKIKIKDELPISLSHSSSASFCIKAESEVFELKSEAIKQEEITWNNSSSGILDISLPNIKSELEEFEFKTEEDIKQEEITWATSPGFNVSIVSHTRNNNAENADKIDELKYNQCNFKADKYHKNEEETTWYQCNECAYKTKRKYNLKLHCATKTARSSDIWYTCNECKYKTNRKYNLKLHSRKHQTADEIIWYKCHHCDYKVKHKKSLITHLAFKHETTLERTQVTKHELKHKIQDEVNKKNEFDEDKNKPVEAQWFKCTQCEYKAKLKGQLTKHLLQHKSADEITWYKCTECEYKCKLRFTLKEHFLRHKSAEEIAWYQCNQCDYKGKHWRSLKKHFLLHKDPSEITWYKCNQCAYKSKQKGALKTHLLQHKDTDEIDWFKCNQCTYKAKQKSSLKAHLSRHKRTDEINWFKCS